MTDKRASAGNVSSHKTGPSLQTDSHMQEHFSQTNDVQGKGLSTMKKWLFLLGIGLLISLACTRNDWIPVAATVTPPPEVTSIQPARPAITATPWPTFETPTPCVSEPGGIICGGVPVPICTPPPCQQNESYSCPSGKCMGGCGTICITHTPSAPAGAVINSDSGSCQVFPGNNPWNRDISNDPLDPNSNNYIRYIMQSAQYLHADFGSNPEWGIPYRVVPADQPGLPIRFTAYGLESDPGPYPIPADAPIEAGSDHHVLVVQSGTCRLFELYHAVYQDSVWNADSGAIFDLNSNELRPEKWTSADAAGLPIFPGLVRYDEVASGEIKHALRFTVSTSQEAYIHPATHWASDVTDSNAPPMGLRLRLKKSYDISTLSGQARVIAEALKKYGMLVADNGTSWYISGASDTRWNDTDLNQLKQVPGSAFEVVSSGNVVLPK